MALQLRLLAAFVCLCTTAAAQLPFVFEPASSGGFVARRPGMAVQIDAAGAAFAFSNGHTLSIALGEATTRVVGEEPLPGHSHYLLGNDRGAWRRDVPHTARVRSIGAAPGIDVVWYGKDGALEYDVVVAAGADAGMLRLDFLGADELEVRPDGSLLIGIGDQTVVQRPPYAYQLVDGQRREVAIAVRKHGHAIEFEPAAYDRALQLIIDPQITYGTYLGGAGADSVRAIAKDAAGNLYLTGFTTSANFPIANAWQPSLHGVYDFFVAKLDPTGSTILWSTFLGGSSGSFGVDEWPVAIAVANSGEVVVLGRAETSDFPTVNAFQPSLAGGVDAVVFKLDASGSQLLWSTYLGGTGNEVDRDNTIGGGGGGVLLDGVGDVFVAATTRSTDFPVSNAAHPSPLGGSDVFVTKFAANGSLVYSSYLGGSGFDELLAAKQGEPGRALLCGSTSGGFPTSPGVFDTSGNRGFVLSLDVQSQVVAWSSTFPTAIAAAMTDAANSVYLVGTVSGDLPTTMGAHQVDHGGSFNNHPVQAFAARLAPGATALVYATYYGTPSDNESFVDLEVDAFGHVYAVGTTSEHYGSTSSSAFVVKFNPQGSSVVYGTDISGRNSAGLAVLLAAPGKLWVAGETWASSGFATPGAVQTAHGGNKDGFLARVEDNATTIRELKFPVDRLTASDARTGTVTLDGIAPPGGATIALTSSSTDVTIPATVVVTAGSATVLVPIASGRVQAAQQVTLTASWNGASAQVQLRLWPGPLYRAIAIPAGSGGEGRAVDAFGTVAGTNGFTAFRFEDSLGVQTIGGGEANGIADGGAIAGGTGAQAFRWSPSAGLQPLGALQPGRFSVGYDADDSGRVVGFSDFTSGTLTGRRAFVWSAGTGMLNLGTLGGNASVAYAINRRGAVTGSAALASQSEHPFVWAGSGMQDLGVLPGFTNGTGLAINDHGDVAGIMLNGSALRAFRHTPGIGLQDLGVLSGDSNSGARGINAFGWTVGWSSPTQANLGRAMRHVESTMLSLQDELSAEDAFAWRLVVANAINDAGQIAGTGTLRNQGGGDRAFRLDPAQARPYGHGCAGLDGRVTALAATGYPAAGTTVRFHVSGQPNAFAVLVLGFGPASLTIPGGCELLVSGTAASLVVGLDAAGTAMIGLPLPGNFAPIALFFQAATIDTAAANGVYTTSNGLEVQTL